VLSKALPADLRLRRPSPDVLRRLARFVPTRRSLVVGAVLVAVAASGYAIARETSLFAIDRVAVTGGSATIDAQVTHALAPFVGTSLVGLDGPSVLQRVEALPTVVSATYDRAFPNTLRLKIVPERPVAVLRAGTAAWVVSERGRVIRSVTVQQAPPLPRIWFGSKTVVRAGEMLPLRRGGTLARVLAAAGSLRSRVATASFKDGQVVFHLRSGLELVLGRPTDIALKVAVTARVFRQMPSWTRVVDVSVPSRPVTSVYSTSS
jgi:cell division protein FtsQ